MTVEERFEGLAAAEAGALERLADRVLADGTDVVVEAGPEVGAAPLRMTLPGTGGSVVVARVVLTTCSVALGGARGDATVAGRAPRAALAAAVCDAEAERLGPLAREVERLAGEALVSRAARVAEEAAGAAATRSEGEA